MRSSLALILALILSLVLWLGASDDRVQVQPFWLAMDADRHLSGRVYTQRIPRTQTSPQPVVILCHGVSSSKDTMAPLATELVRQGIAAVTFDFGGSGESYSRAESQADSVEEAGKVLEWVKQQPGLDGDRIGIAGHSLGGTIALATAIQHPDIQSTIILGIAGEATPRSPKNLWFGSGIYEELNPVSGMRQLFESAVSEPVRAGQTVGSFRQGTARLLVFSPTADHASAPYDPFLVSAAVEWAAKSFNLKPFNLPTQSMAIVFHWQIMGQVLGTIAGLSLVTKLYLKALQTSLLQRTQGIVGVAGLLGLVILAAVVQPSIARHVVLGSVSIVVIANYFHYRNPKIQSTLLYSLTYGLLGYGGLMLAILANSIGSGSLLEHPSGILKFPEFMAQFGFSVIYNQFHSLKNAVFSHGGIAVTIASLTVEILRPGAILCWIEHRFRGILKWVRQPMQLSFQSQTSLPSILVISIGLTVLVGILMQQGRSGLLTVEAVMFVARLTLTFLVFPALWVIVVVRSRGFRNLEALIERVGAIR
jgi:pimeloyl-ACP methyl ester carboxylesterase